MRECPAVARAEIERLQAKGLSLSLDEICWLASLGERVENPAGRSNPLALGVPAVAGSKLLWPETIQALAWLDAVSGWFSASDSVFCLAFALSEGRNIGAFDGLYCETEARQAVECFKQSCNCRPAELLAAVRLVSGDAPAKPDTGKQRPTIREMALEFEYLTGRRPDDVATATVDELNYICRLAEKYNNPQAAKSFDGSRDKLLDLLRAVMEIEARHNGGK
jgi:hypothetical protein